MPSNRTLFECVCAFFLERSVYNIRFTAMTSNIVAFYMMFVLWLYRFQCISFRLRHGMAVNRCIWMCAYRMWFSMLCLFNTDFNIFFYRADDMPYDNSKHKSELVIIMKRIFWNEKFVSMGIWSSTDECSDLTCFQKKLWCSVIELQCLKWVFA